ncbi:MAG: hypothetical protein WA655_16075 [Candidatus Korobacteraceae bacterium]
MPCLRLAAALLCFAATLAAQSLPPGTALPVMLSTGLNAKNTKVGQKIEGRLMQEVTLQSGPIIKSGSHVTGHVVEVSRPRGSGSRIVVAFDQLQDEGKFISLNVSLRALAESENVFQAGVPAGSAGASESSDEWVTKQVGGEFVFRGRGTLESSQGKVGRWSGTGVWGQLAPAGDCPATDANGQEQALWIFSTTACGLYGFEHMKLTHAGNTDPLGQITLESTEDVEVRGGSGWLLIANSAPSNSHAAK